MGTGSALKGESFKAQRSDSKVTDYIAKIRSRRPLEEKIQEEVLIVIFSCLIHVPSEIVILKPKVRPEVAPRWPEISPKAPKDGRL